MLATVAVGVLPVRIKELVYGNVQQGDDLVKGIQTWMLTPVFKIHDRAGDGLQAAQDISASNLSPLFCA